MRSARSSRFPRWAGRFLSVGTAPSSWRGSSIGSMQTSAELRAGFRAYFESKGHSFRPSAPLIPRADDRSTLLTSAGMQRSEEHTSELQSRRDLVGRLLLE